MSGRRRLGYKTYLRYGARQGNLGNIPRQTVARRQNANAQNNQGTKLPNFSNNVMIYKHNIPDYRWTAASALCPRDASRWVYCSSNI